MAALGHPRQRGGMIVRAASRLGRIMHWLLVATMALGVLVLAAAGALTWRLSQGPLDIGWVARRIEAAANLPEQPTRLSIGQAALRWAGFAEGAGRGLDLQLQGVRLTDLRGAPVAAASRLELTVSMARLLLGQVVPRAVFAEGLDLGLLRHANGDVTPDLGGLTLSGDDPAGPDATGPTLSATLAELARPVRRAGTRPQRPDLQHIEELETVRLRNSVLRFQDPALASEVRVDVLSVDVRRQARGGVRGTASAVATLGAASAALSLRAELAPGGGTQVQVAFAPVNAAAVQAEEPALQTSGVLDAAVQGAGTLDLDAGLRPVGGTLRLEAGAGRARLAGALIGFDSLAVDAEATWDRPGWIEPQHATIVRARAVVHAPGGAWPTTLTVAGHVDRTPSGLAGKAEGTVDHVAFADIAGLWPQRWGGHVRPWMVENITAGTARDGAMKASFTVPADFSGVALTAIDGTVRGENVSIWWVRPVPPVEQAQALLTIRDPQTMEIAVSSARQGPMVLTNGLLRITGLADKDQFMALGADVAGGVPELLALLRHPALHVLSRSSIPIQNPAGMMAGHLSVNFPLKDALQFEDVRIQASAKANDLRLAGLVAGRDLDHGAVQFDVSSEALHAGGRATLGDIPADLAIDMDFRNGGPNQVVQKAQLTARVTGKQLATAGLDPGGLLPSGAGAFNARYTQRRDGSGEVQVAADLRDAGLAAVGWTKPPGQPANVAATLVLRGDHMVGIDQLHANGPGMAVEGHVEMAGDRPSLVVLDRVVLGPTQAHGTIRFPAAAEPIRVALSGPVLDLSTQIGAKPAPKPAEISGPSWVADLRFDRVLLAVGRGLSGVVAHAEHDARRITMLDITSAAPEQLHASMTPQGGNRHLVVQAADGGALLRAAGLVETVQGGRLSLDAHYDDSKPSGPLAGTAQLADFNVRNAPVFGKLLQAATIYGVADALSGPGLVFSQLVLPFEWESGMLRINEARAFSSSLGLTARGRIDTANLSLDVQGTVVPAYVINSMLGRIPLIGRLFSAEQGGGLLAVNYTLSGALADPAVTVNPLSALTPGFLRGLFHVFD